MKVRENTSQSLLFLGLALLGEQKPGEAEHALRECVELRNVPATAATWDTEYARNALGASLGAQHRFAEAESLLIGSCGALARIGSAPRRRRHEAVARTVSFYETWEALEPDARAAARSARWRDELKRT